MTRRAPESPPSVTHGPRYMHWRVMATGLSVGESVRIERDEKKYPSRGTWRWYRGKTGVITCVNHAGMGAWEYGVSFSKSQAADAYFKAYELERA